MKYIFACVIVGSYKVTLSNHSIDVIVRKVVYTFYETSEGNFILYQSDEKCLYNYY